MPNTTASLAIILSIEQFTRSANAPPPTGTKKPLSSVRNKPSITSTKKPNLGFLGINLSVAVSADAPFTDTEKKTWLAPWNWIITEWYVSAAKPSAPVQHTQSSNPPGPATPTQEKFYETLVDELNVRLDRCIQDHLVEWQAALNPTTELVTKDKSASWRSLLLDQSMLPSPLSPWLNLSTVLKVDLPDIQDGYLVAPEIKLKNSATTLTPTNISNDNGLWQWSYKVSGGAFTAAAYMPPSAKLQGRDTYIDLRDLMIYSSDNSDEDSADDWRTHLRDRAMSAFDMAQILVDSAEHYSKGAPFTGEQKTALAKMFLASLRDQARPDTALGQSALTEFKSLGGTLDLQFTSTTKFDQYKEWLDSIDPARGSTATNVDTKSTLPPPMSMPGEFLSPFRSLRAVGPNSDLSDILGNMRALHGAMLDQRMLAKLVAVQWEAEHPEFLTTTGYDQFRAFVLDTYFPKLDLRRRFLLQLMLPFVDQLLRPVAKSGDTDAARVRSNFVSALVTKLGSDTDSAASYWNVRFRSDHLKPAINEPAVIQLAENLLAEAQNWATRYGSTFLIPKIESKTSVPPTSVPTPLLITVDRVRLEAGDAGDQDDIQRHTRGVVSFIRRSTAGGTPWRCLNTAQALILKDDGHGHLVPICLDIPVIVASRGGYLAGLSQSVAAYDEGPLAAKGPQAYAADTRVDINSQVAVDRSPIVQYTYWKPNSGLPTDHRSPMSGNFCSLVFSHTYSVFAAAVSNAGILPEILSSLNDPTRLKDALDDSLTLPKNVLHTFPYKRRVPVGPVRVVAHQDPDSQKPEEHVSFPNIPPSVLPMSRDQEKTPPRTDVEGRSLNSLTLPVLMLVPPYFENPDVPDVFDFDVVPPSVDLQTWNRWVRDNKNFDTQRHDAWKQQFGGVAVQRLDPCVRAVLFTVDGKDLQAIPVNHDDQKANRIHVICRLDTSKTLPPDQSDATAKQVKIFVGEGSFKKIEISLLFDANDVSYKFDRIDGFRARPEQGDYVASSFQLHLEAATALLPKGEELIDAATVSFVGPGKIEAKLAPAQHGKPDSFSYIGRVEFHRQVWRWRGRPMGTFNTQWITSSGEVPAELMRWETEQFGDRSDDDHGVFLGSRTDRSEFVYSEDFSSDARAMYMRFAVTAHSRYEALFGPGRPLRSSSSLGNSSPKRRWKRLFIPCRWTEKIPPPKVTVVLPLTEPILTYSDASGQQIVPNQPGLLVVLAEPWYGIGGLAEDFDVDVALSAQNAAGERIAEYGHDPSRFTEACQPQEIRHFWTKAKALEGPVGHTFDVSFENPLFVSSSFVIRPPDLDCAKAWDFIKLRFRRRLLGTLYADYLDKLGSTLTELHTGLGEQNTDVLSSTYTEAHWVQFLPAFSLYSDELDLSRVRVDRSGSTIFLSATPPAQTTGSNLFAASPTLTVAVVTQTVSDIVGDSNQEVFIGLFRPNANLTQWQYLPNRSADSISLDNIPADRLKIRLLEIEGGDDGLLKSVSTQDEFWARLFDDQPTCDATKPDCPASLDRRRARIIRISKAFGNFVSGCKTNGRQAISTRGPIAAKEPVNV
jgi:hypothetical protein